MKRARSTGVDGAVKAMSDAANGPPSPPAHIRMRAGDEPFWFGIVRARAYDEWTECDLVVAAQLARTQADIEREQYALDNEGTTLENARGTKVANPHVAVLENLARREMALMRALRMSGSSVADPRDDKVRRRIQKEAEKIRKEMEEDELLAR